MQIVNLKTTQFFRLYFKFLQKNIKKQAKIPKKLLKSYKYIVILNNL